MWHVHRFCGPLKPVKQTGCYKQAADQQPQATAKQLQLAMKHVIQHACNCLYPATGRTMHAQAEAAMLNTTHKRATPPRKQNQNNRTLFHFHSFFKLMLRSLSFFITLATAISKSSCNTQECHCSCQSQLSSMEPQPAGKHSSIPCTADLAA